MSPPVRLVELKRSVTPYQDQVRRMTKHYDELSGRIAKLIVDKEDMEKVIREGGTIPEAYEAIVFTDYEKANTLWRHTGTLKAKWIEVVGTKRKFPPLPNGSVHWNNQCDATYPRMFLQTPSHQAPLRS